MATGMDRMAGTVVTYSDVEQQGTQEQHGGNISGFL